MPQLITAGVIFTTIHAQDFRDEIGDSAYGRKTLPIVWPRFARSTMLFLLLAWSAFLGSEFIVEGGLSVWLAVPAILFSLAAVVGVRTYLHRNAAEDRKSCKMYNVSPQFCLAMTRANCV
jgi:4-hydroxybenzoate polyprenyltransferase